MNTTTAFETELRKRIRGGVYLDRITRGIYATDASNYQVLPVAIVVPKNEEDVIQAVAVAREHRVSILPRGGGTSLAGQAVGTSMVIDFSRSMNRLVELDPGERWVRVQPGMVCDELNAILHPHGLCFAPDPATATRANIGGMIGTNASGTRSIRYGKTVDHVLALKVLLADGTILQLGHPRASTDTTETAMPERQVAIEEGVRQIIDANQDEIRKRYPKVMRRVSGYTLDELIDVPRWNLAKLVVGSEGTLATVLEATLNLEPLPRASALCIAHFNALQDAIAAVEPLVKLKPSAVELLDKTILGLARGNLRTASRCGFIQGDPAAVLLIEFSGDQEAWVLDQARRAGELIRGELKGYAAPVMASPDEQAAAWDVRKSGLGLLLGMKGGRKPLPFIEDACIPLPVLPKYIDRVLQLCRRLDTEVALYAHASVGVIHVRPILDLRLQEDIDRMKAIAEQAFQLVRKYGGSWSSEHGDGLVRSAFVPRFYGPALYEAFKRVKALFDPDGLMNPGKIIDAPPMDENLRFGPQYEVPERETMYRYRKEGSFAEAVHMCTGVGACRKALSGTMCPSYMALRDEAHCTRGRANALRLAMSGQQGPEGMTDRGLFDVLDLCLSCKACKSECPSNVDMAKLKSEFLQGYYDRHGLPFSARLIGHTSGMAQVIAGRYAATANGFQHNRFLRAVLERVTGIDRRRSLPRYTETPFCTGTAAGPADSEDGRPRVFLFADTYLNYFEPPIGHAAVNLLEACGYRVVTGWQGCCQRPRISSGLLRDAKRDGEHTLQALYPFVQQGMKVVVCEPSCASALTDDLPELVDDEALALKVAENVTTIDDFLGQQDVNPPVEVRAENLVIHPHCHQGALYGTSGMTSFLRRVSRAPIEVLDAGCCGMAGSFGYAKKHYDLSMAIGAQRLFPAVRALEANAMVIASGFSCRHQIREATGIKAVHFVEAFTCAEIPDA